MSCSGNLEGRELVLNALAALTAEDVNILVWKSLTVFMFTKIKDCRCVKANTMGGKVTGKL
jgi:hypothetical protein